MSYAFRRLPCHLTGLSCQPSSLLSRTSRVGFSQRHIWNVTASPRLLSTTQRTRSSAHGEKAKEANQRTLDEHEQEAKVLEKQVKRPWMRQDADKPPVEQADHKAEPTTKGKLLTTPTRLLKLILPLPINVEKDVENNSHEYGRSISSSDTIQPLALLVHPQQPLSYVERLIQAELPPIVEDGKEKIPNVYFRAEESPDEEGPTKSEAKRQHETNQRPASGDNSPERVASYSGLGREGPERDNSEKKWVRWSSSTEMGDFIRDAARGREFAIEVEGYNLEMRVAVPSFNDRTYYMRVHLRKLSRQVNQLSQIKKECDMLAHRTARRLAKGGFALLTGWWGAVYYFTFHTEFGWDLLEPVTYLVGLATIMGGYLWFLYISRELSYKAAMNITVSRRQNALYEARGFDIERWEQLVQDANALRKDLRTIAAEYDVEWDESRDVGEEVREVLDKEESKQERKSGSKDDDEDEEDAPRKQKSKEKDEEKTEKKDS